MFWKKKKKTTDFKCLECGKVHSDWPALGYPSPTYYNCLSQEEKELYAVIDADFCVVKKENESHYFIRVIFNQKVIDCEETLQYGVWVSLSEKSFNDYKENYTNENHETGYFGWLANDLPYYDNSIAIPTDVITKKGKQRPEIFPHTGLNHQFIIDYYEGITSHEAQKRVNEMMTK